MQLPKTYFYSVKLDNNPTSEFVDFYKRMMLSEKDKNDFGEITYFLNRIGVVTGAIDKSFIEERYAERLNQTIIVDEDKNDFGLRLYCWRYNEQVVFLFNGARKTVSGNVELCPNCKPYFDKANIIAKSLDVAFHKKSLFIEDKFIVKTDTEFELKLIL